MFPLTSLVNYKNKRRKSLIKVISATSNVKAEVLATKKDTKSQENMVPQKENNSPATKIKGIGYYDLIDKFKIAIVKKFNELQKLIKNSMKSGIQLINRRSN